MSSYFAQRRSEQHQIIPVNNSSPDANLSSHVGHSWGSTHSQPTRSWPPSGVPDMHVEETNKTVDLTDSLLRFKTEPPSFFSHNKRIRRTLYPLDVNKQRSERSFSDSLHTYSNYPDFRSSPHKSIKYPSPRKDSLNSDSEIDTITPPLSPAYLFGNAQVSATTTSPPARVILLTSPIGHRQNSSSSRRGSGRKSSGRQPSGSRDKGKGKSTSRSQDRQEEKESDSKDSGSGGGDKEKDRGVKSRQRTAIACNYCRRRKVRVKLKNKPRITFDY